MTFLEFSTTNTGRFLIWVWELWEIGGGGGVAWYISLPGYKREITPGRYNPLWWVFEMQRRRR